MSSPESVYTRGVIREGKKPDELVSVIMAGVHGNEPAGRKAFDLVVPDLTIKNGKVIFIYGNPRAMAEGTRFSQGGANLNGMFKDDADLSVRERSSYEYDRAQELKPTLLSSTALLDVHGTANPDSVPFVIAEPGKPLAIARHLPYDIISSGYDEQQPGGTDHFMNKHGRVGICCETGPNGHEHSVPKAVESIRTFLQIRGHIEGETEPRDNQKHIRVKGMHRAKDTFTFREPFPEFAPVEKDEVIGTDGSNTITASDKGYLIFTSQLIVPPGDEAFLFGKDAPLR